MSTDDSKDKHSRRSFLVRMAGVTVGTFFLPSSFGAKATGGAAEIIGSQAAAAEAAAFPASSQIPLVELLMKPIWNRRQNGDTLMIYMLDDCKTMVWIAENEEEFADMKHFYEATRNPGCPQVAESEVFPIRRSVEEKTLIRRILSDPDASSPRQAYAKWLCARSDPAGEVIRQYLLAYDPAVDEEGQQVAWERYQELRNELGPQLCRPLAALGLWPTIGGTFVPEAWMAMGSLRWADVNIPGILPNKADQLFQAVPLLTGFKIQFDHWDVEAICAHPNMTQIRVLEFEEELFTRFSPDDMQALVESKNLVRLKNLTLGRNRLDSASIEQFATSRLLKGLSRFELGHGELEPDALRPLFQSDRIGGLEELNLNNNSMDESILERECFRNLTNLETLRLEKCELEDRGFRALLRAEWPPKLKHLAVSDNNITGEGVCALAGCAQASALTHLELGHVALQRAEALAIANSNYLGAIEEFKMGKRDMDEECCEILAQRFGDKLVLE